MLPAGKTRHCGILITRHCLPWVYLKIDKIPFHSSWFISYSFKSYMSITKANYSSTSTSKLILLLSIFAAAFCVLVSFVNVYRYALVGAIYEILWLPVLGILFIAPVIAILLWRKEKFTLTSLYPYSILICVATLVLVIFFN